MNVMKLFVRGGFQSRAHVIPALSRSYSEGRVPRRRQGNVRKVGSGGVGDPGQGFVGLFRIVLETVKLLLPFS